MIGCSNNKIGTSLLYEGVKKPGLIFNPRLVLLSLQTARVINLKWSGILARGNSKVMPHYRDMDKGF